MYEAERFLEFANSNTPSKVSREIIDEVRAVSASYATATAEELLKQTRMASYEIRVRYAVKNWLRKLHPNAEIIESTFPDMVVRHEDEVFGFEIKILDGTFTLDSVSQNTAEAYKGLMGHRLNRLTIIWIMSSPWDIGRLRSAVATVTPELDSSRFGHLIAVVEDRHDVHPQLDIMGYV